METEYQDFKMVCSNTKCNHSYRLKWKERNAGVPTCYKCENVMTKEFSDEYIEELTARENDLVVNCFRVNY